MSLITRCPACGTTFKVVPDQLKISDGWVRCGHCAEVFDAPAQMVQEVPSEPIAKPTTTVQPDTPLPAAVSAKPTLGWTAGSFTPPVFESLPKPSPNDLSLTSPFVPKSSVPTEPDLPPTGEIELTPEASSHWADKSRVDDTKEMPDVVQSEVSFVQDAKRRAFWRGPWVRLSLTLVALVLLALLCLQVVVHERNRIAAYRPQFRPWLNQLCQPLGCQLTPLRSIEALVIEGSSFNRLPSQAYRLSFSIKNNSPVELAMPAVEITLTDTQDQALLRRVLQGAELGPHVSTVLPAGGEWTTTLTLAVSPTDPAATRVAGYRLLAFYP